MESNFLKYYSILSLWGVQILLLFVYYFGLSESSQLFTFPYRISVALIAIYILVKNINYIFLNNDIKLVFFFFVLMFLRLIYENYRTDIKMGTDAIVYTFRWLSIVVIPTFPFILKNKFNAKNLLDGFTISVYIFFFITTFFYSDFFLEDYRSLSHNFDIENHFLISPLIFGYMGLFGGAIFLWHWKQNKSFPSNKIFLLIISIFLLVYSGSRGPFLSFILTFLILFRKTFIFTNFKFILGFFFLFSIFFYLIEFSDEFSLIKRFQFLFNNLETGNYSELGSYRFITWKNAINQYIDSPFFGSGIEEFKSKYVAHNMFIEAFCSTGIIGGSIFLYIIYKSLKKAFFLIKINSSSGFLSVIFLSRVITGLISSSVLDPIIWFLIVLLAISHNYEINSKYRL